MLVESVVCWCTFWKDALLRMPVETEEVTEFECASRVCTVLSMTEETPGGGYLARGQYVTQEFSRTPSRMEGQTSVDVTEEDDAIEMPETNVRCQSAMVPPVCIPTVDSLSLGSSSSSRSTSVITSHSQEIHLPQNLSDWEQNGLKDNSGTLQVATLKRFKTTVALLPEISVVEVIGDNTDEMVSQGLKVVPSSWLVSKAQSLDGTDSECMTPEMKWQSRAVTWKNTIAKNAQHGKVLDCQEIRSCTEIPRPLLTDILEEAVPVVQKAAEIYKRELGARDPLTTQAVEHLKKLRQRLDKLNMQ
ncbi:uncharacterized protein LOC134179774 [Corticium candelabrum]|uniref:uncharacterized protein LOC134179774 n=1 Tax=Corticium candelabrum TaxID=121492 RepID=UPI002E263928|nr:uncharacterized protein LOC134179774 [Corticium candelabrum]